MMYLDREKVTTNTYICINRRVSELNQLADGVYNKETLAYQNYEEMAQSALPTHELHYNQL